MPRFILCVILSAIAAYGTSVVVKSWYIDFQEELKTQIYYNHATVTELGECTKDGMCSFTYLTDGGDIGHSTISQTVTVGQKVYQQCWTEKVRGKRCYVNYEP